MIENIISILVEKLIKLSVIFLAIKSAKTVIDFSLNFFLEVGIVFGGNKTFLDGNGLFNFNQIWGHFGDLIGTVTMICSKFNGTHAIFYGLVLLIVLIMCAIVLTAMFTSLLEFYIIGVMMFLTLPLNVFTPLTDLSKGIIKTFIITGLKISIYLVMLNISISVLQNYLMELESIGITESKNDISAMLFFIVLLGLVCAIFFSMEAMALYILTGSGTGLSFTRLGNMATQGVSTAVNTGITVAAVFAGGSGLVKAGADAGVKGAQVAGKSVKSFSNVMKAGSTVARKGADTVNKGIATATDSEETTKPTRQSGAETLKKAKSAFQRGKNKK